MYNTCVYVAGVCIAHYTCRYRGQFSPSTFTWSLGIKAFFRPCKHFYPLNQCHWPRPKFWRSFISPMEHSRVVKFFLCVCVRHQHLYFFCSFLLDLFSAFLLSAYLPSLTGKKGWFRLCTTLARRREVAGPESLFSLNPDSDKEDVFRVSPPMLIFRPASQ